MKKDELEVVRLARFAEGVRYSDLSSGTIEQLKIRLLDSLAVAFGAIGLDVPEKVARFAYETGSACGGRKIGGGYASVPHAAFYNSTLIRYLDFNDSYLAKNETFHPSDAIGGILSAADFSDRHGTELLAAMALSYQIQAALSEKAPVRPKGFDHTVQLNYGAAAAVAKMLGLSSGGIANAVSIAGTAHNALRVTRTGRLSHWKGLAAPYAVFGATNAAMMAREGITGPLEVFEGNKGLQESITGPFEIDWERLGLGAVHRSILKKYNAEIHSQPAIEAVLELREEHGFSGLDVESVKIEVFDVAYHIIGGGEEGDKRRVETKEEADHSLPYMVAVALLDGELTPRQYEPDRIRRSDVQSLLKKISVSPSRRFSGDFPEAMPTEVQIRVSDGREFIDSKRDYEGFHTRRMSFERVMEKFESVTRPVLDRNEIERVIELVRQVEKLRVRELMEGLDLGIMEEVRRWPRLRERLTSSG